MLRLFHPNGPDNFGIVDVPGSEDSPNFADDRSWSIDSCCTLRLPFYLSVIIEDEKGVFFGRSRLASSYPFG